MISKEAVELINKCDKDTLVENLGIKLISLSEGKIAMSMPVDTRTKQRHGFLHGGASVALAETAASLGSYHLVDQENEIVFGLEINANHVKPKRDGIVTAFGEMVHKGRTTQVWEIKIKDESDELICVSRCTLAIVGLKNK